MLYTQEDVENYRDRLWRRDESLRILTPADVESLVEDIGFCLGLTDSRTEFPSVYIGVCGRRDVHSPRNVQKDVEMSLAWTLKDDVMLRGRVYYAKLVKGRSTFLAKRMIAPFNAIWGITKKDEPNMLSADARAILKVLRREWEMGTADLRAESGLSDRAKLTKALDELQLRMKVVPQEVLYQPKFTYIWTLAEGRFPDELKRKMTREAALREIAEAFLRAYGKTRRGQLSSAFGFKRPEAGWANNEIVEDGLADRIETGVYRWRD
jgi:hypothetical protein